MTLYEKTVRRDSNTDKYESLQEAYMKVLNGMNEAKKTISVDDDYLYPKSKIDVQADIFGDWGVHKTTGSPNKFHAWSISHIPSGKHIATFQKNKEAKDGAKKLSIQMKGKGNLKDLKLSANMVLKGFSPDPQLKIDNPSPPSKIETRFGMMPTNKNMWNYFVKEVQKTKSDFIKKFERKGLPKKSTGVGDDMFIEYIFKTVEELVMEKYKYIHMRAHSAVKLYGDPAPLDRAHTDKWIKIGGKLDSGTPLGDL